MRSHRFFSFAGLYSRCIRAKSRQLPGYLVGNLSSILSVVNPAVKGDSLLLSRHPHAVRLPERFVKDTGRKIVPCMRVVILCQTEWRMLNGDWK